MNLRRIWILLGKELRYTSKNFIFVFAIGVPIALTLLVSLLFGTLFSGKPKLGINDQGSSALTTKLSTTEGLLSRQYPNSEELKAAVESGAVDLGLVIPQKFDRDIESGGEAQLEAYVWGESLQRNRALIATSLVVLVREMIGQEAPVEIISTSLGSGESIPWDKRIFPFIVFVTIVMGGSMVPATSLVEEKQKRTLKALVITPTTLVDVFTAKGVLGFLVSLLVGVFILILNQAFGSQPLLLVGVLALSAVFAAEFGVLLGVLFKDINTLFAVMKAIGILLYAPALILLFSGIPQWIAKIFPTYYMIGPIMDVSQKDASWSQVAGDVYILIGLIIVLLIAIGLIVRRESDSEV
jgi:ABC-2 type transport system permease protein